MKQTRISTVEITKKLMHLERKTRNKGKNVAVAFKKRNEVTRAKWNQMVVLEPGRIALKLNAVGKEFVISVWMAIQK